MSKRRSEINSRQRKVIAELEKQQESRIAATAEAFLASELADDTAEYLHRGRRFKALADDDVKQLWTSTAKTWLRERQPDQQRKMSDLGAELGLRNLGVPHETVRAELSEAMQDGSIDDPPPGLIEKIRAFREKIAKAN